jgi:hypothetical protein
LNTDNLREPIREFPLAIRGALDHGLRAQVLEEAMGRAKRQCEVLGDSPHSQWTTSSQQLDNMHSAVNRGHAARLEFRIWNSILAEQRAGLKAGWLQSR